MTRQKREKTATPGVFRRYAAEGSISYGVRFYDHRNKEVEKLGFPTVKAAKDYRHDARQAIKKGEFAVPANGRVTEKIAEQFQQMKVNHAG